MPPDAFNAIARAATAALSALAIIRLMTADERDRWTPWAVLYLVNVGLFSVAATVYWSGALSPHLTVFLAQWGVVTSLHSVIALYVYIRCRRHG